MYSEQRSQYKRANSKKNSFRGNYSVVQKVCKQLSCPFAKRIPLEVHHFGKRTAWSLLYTFWTMSIIIFSQVSNFGDQSLYLFISITERAPCPCPCLLLLLQPPFSLPQVETMWKFSSGLFHFCSSQGCLSNWSNHGCT